MNLEQHLFEPGLRIFFPPGTSTIRTRAKYFFIVPYALKDLERSGETNPNQILKQLDQIDQFCAQTFFDNNPIYREKNLSLSTDTGMAIPLSMEQP